MPQRFIEGVGQRASGFLIGFGDFCNFVFSVFGWLFGGGLRWKTLRNLLPQLYDVGVRSVPVVGVVGAFIGMVMAVETYSEFKALGQEYRLGVVIVISVVTQTVPDP